MRTADWLGVWVPQLLVGLAFVMLLLGAAGCGAVQRPGGAAMELPPLPILGPTALTADAGDGRAYLRWNLQLEDPRVVGWRVLQVRPTKAAVGEATEVLAEPSLVVKGLTNGTEYEFAVVGVLKDGGVTPASNSVVVRPRATGTAKVVGLRESSRDKTGAITKLGDALTFGEFKDVPFGHNAAKVVFPDGQELIYDNYRPVDWKTAGGQHLLYPLPFGNGLDIGRFDDRGLPSVIPPEGLKEGKAPGQDVPHDPAQILNQDYRDVQAGTKHPYITDPLTQPMSKEHHDNQPKWLPPQIDGDRVTLHYWQPMAAMGYKAWVYVLVWETWWPVERDRHGCKYRGLARLVEVQMPGALKYGYQVMLNNGFGPAGSRKGVVSYSAGFRRPGCEIVDFTGEKNCTVMFQGPKPPRRGGGYHPNQDCLQASPLIFYDWPGGSMTIAARSLYYHCSNNSSSYVEQGADGVWPNLAWDLAIAGRRTAVDTVEYLHAADTAAQPLPQRFLNARFEAYGDVSRRMGVQDDLAATSATGSMANVRGDGGPAKHAEKQIATLRTSGADAFYIYHDYWHAVPITVDDAYRLDPNHDCNPLMRAGCDKFHKAGLICGFWYRPEFTKTSIVNALSETIPTAETYYGYNFCKYPDCVELLKQRGIPLFRQNTDWVRRRRDGSWPTNTPYNWVPMSLATPWWDRIMWPTLRMSRELGFDFILMDGGFGGMQGVYYTHGADGAAAGAVAAQPYWWRVFRSMKHIGIRNIGECTLGWKGGNVTMTGAGDEHFLWMYQFTQVFGNEDLKRPEQVHKLYQLYNSMEFRREDKASDPVRRFAHKFRQAHPRGPDWIELKDLRQAEAPVEVVVTAADSPVAGGPTRATPETPIKYTVRPWTWTDAVWHYDDGTSVVYPDYGKVDWAKE
jgi:hypothetical protein